MRTKAFIVLSLIWIVFFAGLSVKPMFKNIPYGTVRLTDSLYIDKQPIRVIDYIEFLSDIRHSYTPRMHDSIAKLPLYGLSEEIAYGLYDSLSMDTAFYERMLTRTWQTIGNDRHIYGVDYRLRSAKYYNYPIVNINYYQIFEFCRWRSDKVKLHYAVISKTLKQRKKYPINFEYRIIKHKEWEKAMSVFFEEIGKLKRVNDGGALLNIAKPYPKSNGFSYQSVNAAEYLDNEIVTIGFNWIDEAGLGDVSYMHFEKSTDWVTFRCICEIKDDGMEKPEVKKKTAPKKKLQKSHKPDPKPKEKKVKGIKSEKAQKKKRRH